jgi:hypothetical protein
MHAEVGFTNVVDDCLSLQFNKTEREDGGMREINDLEPQRSVLPRTIEYGIIGEVSLYRRNENAANTPFNPQFLCTFSEIKK